MLPSSVKASGDSSYSWIVLGITSVAFFMSPFDASVVNVALPSIQASLNISLAAIIWIPAVYLLVIASTETTVGRLGDIRGKKSLYIISLAVFVAGSLFAGLSVNALQLIIARIVQGLGAAGMDAIGFAILAGAFRSRNRGRAFGINQMTIYIGLTCGPVIGGILVQNFGWRSIFYVNVPIGLAAAVLTLIFIRKDSPASPTGQRFDFIGAFTLTAFLTLLLLILNDAGFKLSSAQSDLLYVACIASIASFIYIEVRIAASPLLDLHLFTQNRLFAGGATTSMMNYLTVYSTFFVLSLYLQTILGFSPVNTGLVLLAQPILMVVSSPIAGMLSERISARFLSSLGMAIKSVAFFILTFLGVKSPIEGVLVPLVMIGIGHGFFSSPNLNSVMSSVGPGKFGIASGTMGTIRQAAQSIGISIMGGIIASNMPSGSILQYGSNSAVSGVVALDFVTGMRIAFFVACGFSVVGVFTSLLRGKKSDLVETKDQGNRDS
ncbi:MAG: MFS transporter [Thaumarchaeota archaeon]|nr:MFS transporter [Nitrososphaerota archaeon]